MSWRKRNKAASWKTPSLILILCPNTMGSRLFFWWRTHPRTIREKMMVSLGVSITFCLSWVTFSEGSWEKSNWTITVWPSALWKSMCKCCGLLFLPGKEKHCKVTEQGDSKEVNSLWKQCSCTLPASVCGVNAACQLFIFASLKKIYPVFAGEPERSTGNFLGFKWRGWEALHFQHIERFSQAGSQYQCRPLTDVTHTAQTHRKLGRLNTSQW